MSTILLCFLSVFFLGTNLAMAETKTVHMQIEGMTCSMCSQGIQKKLSALCAEVTIDHKTGHGHCMFDAGKTTPEAIIKTVTDAGYKVESHHL